MFQELPFHPIFILLFLPPDKNQNDKKKVQMHQRRLKLHFVFVCVGGKSVQMKRALPNHLQRFCCSSSFFLIFSCLASSISSFVFLIFFDTACSSSSFFTICAEERKKLTMNHVSSVELVVSARLPLMETEVYLLCPLL